MLSAEIASRIKSGKNQRKTNKLRKYVLRSTIFWHMPYKTIKKRDKIFKMCGGEKNIIQTCKRKLNRVGKILIVFHLFFL